MISPQVLDFLKFLTEFLGMAAIIFGLIKGSIEISQSRRLRAEELRWKRANSAKELLDDIHNHELERNAANMLDHWDSSDEYTIGPQERVDIHYNRVLEALAKNASESRNDTEKYIRKCFDWFFYRVDRIQHYINRGLIDFEDVKPVFYIYAREITKHRQIFDSFLAFHEYELARQFLRRCNESPQSPR